MDCVNWPEINETLLKWNLHKNQRYIFYSKTNLRNYNNMVSQNEIGLEFMKLLEGNRRYLQDNKIYI